MKILTPDPAIKSRFEVKNCDNGFTCTLSVES